MFGIIKNVLNKNVNFIHSNQNKNAKILCLFVLQMVIIVFKKINVQILHYLNIVLLITKNNNVFGYLINVLILFAKMLRIHI